MDPIDDRLPAAPFEVQCAIVHSLMILGDESSNEPLMHAWDAMPTEQRFEICQTLTLDIEPDGGGSDPQELVSQETFAMKTLEAMGRMRASSPAVRVAVEPWLQSQIDEPSNTLKTREAAGSLLNGIKSARNDIVDPAEAD